jgi:hypothetical protein
MAKLSKKQREQLGDIINTLQVCEICKKDEAREENWDRYRFWMQREEDYTIKLFEEFGVALPMLKHIQDKRQLNEEAA